MSLKDADKLTPAIRLSKIIGSLSPSDVKTDRIIVASPSYMQNLTDILTTSSKKTLQTYFIWKVIKSYASVIEADELKPYSRFRNNLQGKVRLLTLPSTILTYLNRIQIPSQSGGEFALTMLMMG
jgi:endothelin-converting enzyme